MSTLTLAIIIIAVALLFDYINGFHDAANSIATIVATRVMNPFQAVVFAAFFNFVSALVFGTGVAKTVGKGFVNTELLTLEVLLAGLAGAVLWDLITWWWGLPTSSSHALIGGLAGAALANAAYRFGVAEAGRGLIVGQWPKTLGLIVVAPLVGLVMAYFLMIAVYWLFRHSTPSRMDVYFRKLQLVSAALLSAAHGTNDAQKTMGIITGVLVAAQMQKDFTVPLWVIMAASAAIGLGTLSGGWRIVHTMGSRLTRLKPRGGFCAETAAAVAIFGATLIHQPVSTTHVIAGSIAGVGSIHRFKAVRWGIATNIVWAWVMTIPAAAAIAMLSFWLVEGIRKIL
jgi:inorganic phosphate transporter, PiT family